MLIIQNLGVFAIVIFKKDKEVIILNVTFSVITKYYPDLPDEELKKIQKFVYLLGCGIMQYFYGPHWEKDMGDPDLENKED